MTFKERAEIALKALAKQEPVTLEMAREQVKKLKMKYNGEDIHKRGSN